MNQDLINLLEKQSQLPLAEIYKGRKTNSDLGIQYYYQAIQTSETDIISSSSKDIGLLGYACDEGVKRNQGRVGARFSPNAIRSRLGKLAYHDQEKKIVDYGNIDCINNDLEDCQSEFSRKITKLLDANIFPLAIGGGHDMAFAHLTGIWNAIKNNNKNRIGIINFDAHFDLRPVTDFANSGTPFYQILSDKSINAKYFILGIQQASNTKELFEIADQLKVKFLLSKDCLINRLDYVKQELDKFIADVDHVYISIDMDGFSSSVAPGVSAPSPFGLQPHFVTQTLEHIFQSKKVIACDIAETNPLYDMDNNTCNLAARLIDHIIRLVA